MKITSISSSCSLNVQVGPREFIKPFVSLTAELEEGDDLGKCAKELHKEVQKLWCENAMSDVIATRKMKQDKVDMVDEVVAARRIKKLSLELNK